MHIEPGLVADGKLWLSYLTAAGAAGYGVKLAWNMVRENGVLSLGPAQRRHHCACLFVL